MKLKWPKSEENVKKITKLKFQRTAFCLPKIDFTLFWHAKFYRKNATSSLQDKKDWRTIRFSQFIREKSKGILSLNVFNFYWSSRKVQNIED